jgi:ATP-binding cassette subfamily F protein uup
VGGYTDWLRQHHPHPQPAPAEKEKPAAPARERTRAKLSYKETRELAALPGEIEALEAEQHALAARRSAPDYYRQGADALREDQRRSEEIEALLMEKLERWEVLEAKAAMPS